jgi:Family of unknown function (DUF5313)
MASGRPNVLRWLYYAYGGRLPPRYAQWVLHDLTARTWFVRLLARALVECAPALLLLFFPASPGLLAMMVGIVVFGVLFYSMAFAWEIRNHRLYQHGFIPDLVLRRPGDDDDLGGTGDGPDEDKP